MTRPEFEQWRQRHCALFPGLLAFVAKTFGSDSSMAQAMWDEWYKALRHVSLEDALEASRRLAADGQERYERHPWAVRDIARDIKVARGDWDALAGPVCEICDGVGAVVIRRPDGRQATTICTCNAGHRMRKAWPEMATYDPAVHQRA